MAYTDKKKTDTSQRQIDNRINEIDKNILSLNAERKNLIHKRSDLFISSDIQCELKYEFTESEILFLRDCIFYIELNNHKEILVKCNVSEETPDDIWIRHIPEKYKKDFFMLWQRAYTEQLEYEKDIKFAIENKNNSDKEFYKQCYRVLAKVAHPDLSGGNTEAMQCLNKLKGMWGV